MICRGIIVGATRGRYDGNYLPVETIRLSNRESVGRPDNSERTLWQDVLSVPWSLGSLMTPPIVSVRRQCRIKKTFKNPVIHTYIHVYICMHDTYIHIFSISRAELPLFMFFFSSIYSSLWFILFIIISYIFDWYFLLNKFFLNFNHGLNKVNYFGESYSSLEMIRKIWII